MQQIQLQQFALFANLQAQLSAITAEQLATVKAGKSLSGGETVVGTLPDHLKGLLYLRSQVGDKANNFIAALPKGRPSDKALGELAELKQVSEKANDLFWEAFQAEFPNLSDKGSIGYGPAFEVYYSDTPQVPSDLMDMLRGSIVVHLG